ncbi:hypothetical protein TNCV_242841 [Trichonephila clavipes]|uniref:Uncharacterized protein n=1 Tax=Trichonephila clavipes TaxID=2585209 RepID=A0A8X6W462_TRICX|nr:hypothetical protein TNCV_242841 [Trichonephila clavipes]
MSPRYFVLQDQCSDVEYSVGGVQCFFSWPLEASARRFVSLPAYSTIRLVNPLKSLVLRCGCRRFGNPTFVYGLRNATMHSHSVVSPVMILSILLWLRTWMLKLSPTCRTLC